MKFIGRIVLIFFCTFFSCKTKHDSPIRDVMTLSKVGDSINKTGYLIYDSKKEFTSFIESKFIDINNISKDDIIMLTHKDLCQTLHNHLVCWLAARPAPPDSTYLFLPVIPILLIGASQTPRHEHPLRLLAGPCWTCPVTPPDTAA